MVFVHGVSGSSSAWWPYEKIFENKYNILTFDIRGHGKLKKFPNYSDYKIKNFWAWCLTVVIPFVIFLTGFTSFIKVIGITGAIAGGIDGILIVLMFHRARKKHYRTPEYHLGKKYIIGIFLMLMFILGLIYQVYHLF